MNNIYLEVDNQKLIFNGLEHIEFEFSTPSTCYFRIARESHQILYRSLIEALKGTANLEIIRSKNKKKNVYYFQKDNSILEIHEEKIKGCYFAWRFSKPTKIKEIPQNVIQNLKSYDNTNSFLIGFYEALAMIQEKLISCRYIHSRVVNFTDEEMKIMEWLHEDIRNIYEHFVPLSYLPRISDCLYASKIAIHKANSCLFETNNVHFFNHSISKKDMINKFTAILRKIDSHIKKFCNIE